MDLEAALKKAEESWRGSRDEEGSSARARHVVAFFGPTTKCSTLSVRHVRKFKDAHQQSHSPATINRYLAALSKLLTVAEEEEWITARPRISRMREPDGRVRVLSDEELDALRGEMTEEHRDLVTFLLYTGMRVGEALKLLWSDMRRGELVLRADITKSKRQRIVPIHAKVEEILVRMKGNDPGPFSGVSQSAFNKSWSRARAKAGLEDDREVVPHALRHTCASRLVSAGVNLIVIGELLGHRDPRTTKRYAHLDTTAVRSALDLL